MRKALVLIIAAEKRNGWGWLLKKLISVFMTVLILLPYSCSFAYASGVAEFSLDCDGADKNRIFPITVSAKGSCKISAVLLIVDYDTDYIDYRSIKTTLNNSEVRAYNENGRLRIIFLNNDGIDISKDTPIFTISFKAENSGNTYVYMGSEELVDSDVNEAGHSVSNQLNLTINGGKVTYKSEKNSYSYQPVEHNTMLAEEISRAISNSDDSELDEDAEQKNEQEKQATNGGLSFIPNEDATSAFIAGAGFAILLVLLFFAGMRYGQRQREKPIAENVAENSKQDSKTDCKQDSEEEMTSPQPFSKS